MQQFINRLMPFFMMGIAIVVFGFGIMVLAHLFLIGVAIAVTLLIISRIRQSFFPNRNVTVDKNTPSGRIFDATDWHRKS